MSKKLWGYARVSTREQNLARQLFELQKYVAKDDIFIDKQSGKNFDREQYKQLRAMAREGDELYIKSIDRLGRNKEGIKVSDKEYSDQIKEYMDGFGVKDAEEFETYYGTPVQEYMEMYEVPTNMYLDKVLDKLYDQLKGNSEAAAK